MKKTSEHHPLSALAAYLPEGSFERVLHYIQLHHVKLVLTVARRSVLGNYKHSIANGQHFHTITVNGNLNKYELLITFLHELAHLTTTVQYGRRAASHGPEWKQAYRLLLIEFCAMGVFPPPIVQALQPSITNPSATANGEHELLQVIREYGVVIPAWKKRINQLADGDEFEYQGHRYTRIHMRRTRILAKEKATGKDYLFSGLTEVKKIDV